MNFEIRPLSESEFAAWDELVEKSPEGTLFHNTFWLKASGERFVIYGYFKGGELFAGIPVSYTSSFKIKVAGLPLLTPYFGVVLKGRETKYVQRMSQDKEIVGELVRRLKKDFNAGLVHLIPGWVDLQPFIWEGLIPGIRYTYIIDLNMELEQIWGAMNDKRRNDIRKAEKDGIRVVAGDNFETTYSLVEKTFARQERTVAFKQAALRYNEALAARNQCRAFLAKNGQDEPIAAVYIVWDSRRSYYLLGGYDPDSSHHGASALAMWEAIKFTKEELGLGGFDFEGSMVPQIEQFFRKFGGRLTPYYTVSWSRPYLKLIPSFIKNVAGRVLSSRLR
ncbi:lipid II:glycine glycyltransferase FemX [Chloroflexota bacterium]